MRMLRRSPVGGRRRMLAFAVAIASSCIALSPAVSVAGAGSGPKPYYLALGDSYAWGYQPDGNYSAGYADDFFAFLQPKGTTTLNSVRNTHPRFVASTGNRPHEGPLETRAGRVRIPASDSGGQTSAAAGPQIRPATTSLSRAGSLDKHFCYKHRCA